MTSLHAKFILVSKVDEIYEHSLVTVPVILDGNYNIYIYIYIYKYPCIPHRTKQKTKLYKTFNVNNIHEECVWKYFDRFALFPENHGKTISYIERFPCTKLIFHHMYQVKKQVYFKN